MWSGLDYGVLPTGSAGGMEECQRGQAPEGLNRQKDLSTMLASLPSTSSAGCIVGVHIRTSMITAHLYTCDLLTG